MEGLAWKHFRILAAEIEIYGKWGSRMVFYYKCAIIIYKNACIIINVCNVEGFKKDSGAVKCPRGTFI